MLQGDYQKGAGLPPVAPVVLDAPVPIFENLTKLLAFGASRQVADWSGARLNGKNIDTTANFQNAFDAVTGKELVES